MASNASLGINNDNSTRHPALVLSVKPLLVVSGSDSRRHDIDAIVVSLEQTDLEATPRGLGLSAATDFDVCRTLPLQSLDELVSFMGKLTLTAWQRVLAERKHCW